MPQILARAARLSAGDWILLAGAAVAQLTIACAIRVTKLPAVRAAFARLRPFARLILQGSDERVVWAIETTGRRLRGVSTCLVRALLVELRLSTPERPLQLTIGVTPAALGRIRAHAWVRDGDRVVIGGPVPCEFQPMIVWERVAA